MLSIGIATNAVVFSVLDGILFRPPPGVGSTDRIVEVWSTVRAEFGISSLTYREFLAYQEQDAVFEEVAVYSPTRVALSTDGPAEMVPAEFASSSYFSVLDLRIELGAGFAPGDDRRGGAAPYVVIGHAEWQARFGGSAEVVGLTVQVNGQPYTIVGVAPERFYGAGGRDDPVALWLPAADQPLLFPEDADLVTGTRRSFAALARLVEGATISRTEAVVEAAWRDVAIEMGSVPEERRVEVAPYRGLGSRQMAGALGIVGTIGGLIGGLVLLVACANVSGLLLGRALQRRREIGVRLALGAGRRRIVQQLLTESALIATIAGVVGVLLTLTSLDVLERSLFTFPVQLVPGGVMLALTVGVTAATAVLAGLTPALHATGASVFAALKDRVAGASRKSWRLRNGLTVAQLALSLPLLTAAGLLLGQFVGDAERSGFSDPDAVLTVRIDLQRTGLTAEESAPFLSRARERIAAVPGVANAAFTDAAPPSGFGGTFALLEPGPGGAEASIEPTRLRVAAVDPEYFAAVGIPIVRGRAIEATDLVGTPQVAVVDEAVARLGWPGSDPVGRTVTIGQGDDQRAVTIVGVAGSILRDPGPTAEAMLIYAPRAQVPHTTSSVLVARAASAPASALVPTVRAELASLDEDLIMNASLLGEVIRASRTELAHGAAGAAACALIALLMACVGLYGMIATGVTERTREIGVRIALGADRSRVVAEFVRRGLVVTLIALGVGLPLSWAMIPVVGSGIVGVGAFAPQVALGLGGVALVMMGVAGISSWIPARRSSTVDPVRALGSE